MKIALLNCNLFDGNKDSDIKLVNILLDGEIIEKVVDVNEELSDEYVKIDLENKYVVPGLINLHSHLFGSGKPSKTLGGKSKKQQSIIKFCGTKLGQKILKGLVKKHVKEELYSGVTTLRSSGDFYYSDVKVRDLVNEGKAVGPKMIVPGPAITVSGGHGDGTFAMTGDTKEELTNLVNLNKEHNVDYIKICVTGGVMDAKKKGEPGELKMNLEQTKTICDLAHKYGFKVASHTESNAGVKVALAGGVDTIEHGSFIDEEDIKMYKKTGSVNVFTISPALPLSKFEPSVTLLDELSIYNSDVVVKGMIDGAKKCLENDILVGLGTDASCPFATQYGMWREVYQFAKYVGVSNKFALYSATLVNAKILNMDKEIGSVEENKIADLLVLENNPLEDLEALRDIDMIINKGTIINKPKIKKNKYIEDKLDTLL